MKVLCPLTKSSLAPIRVKILSTGEMEASRAGMKEPTCVINVSRADCRIYVDLPAILGPVIIMISF